MKATLKKLIVPFLVGVLGVGAALAAYHVYVDHRNLHVLLTWAVKADAAMKTPEAK